MFIGLIRHNIRPSACVVITVSGPDEIISKTEYESFTLNAGVLTGSTPITYQWQVKYPEGGSWQDILGANSNTYTEPAGLGLDQDGTQYRCNISNACSSVTSRVITVIIIILDIPPPP